MNYQLNKQPREIQTKINAHLRKIATLNSTELLDYSKSLNGLKSEIDTNTRDYLFEAVWARTDSINSGVDKIMKCKYDKMVKDFKKGQK